MNQHQLNRAVARATSETVDRIARMGFGITIVPARSVPIMRSSRRRRGRPRKRSQHGA